jgi:hypothetical protein
MAKEKTKTTLDKIEKLIVDGQKEVLERVGTVESSLREEIQTVETSLREEIQGVRRGLYDKIDKVDKKVELNAKATHDLLTDVREDVRRVENKLDEHIKSPAHAGS